MYLSHPTGQLFEIQQMALPLLQIQTATVHQVTSSFRKTYSCANRLAQLCQLCHVIYNDMLTITILLLTYFVLFTFLVQVHIDFRDLLYCNYVHFLCGFLFLMWLSLWMVCPIIALFIFWDLVCPHPSAEPGWGLSVMFMLLSKNHRQLL